MYPKIYAAVLILLLLGSYNPLHAEIVYFFVGNPYSSDGYVLPLENPSHIAHARDLINNGPSAGRRIVVA